MQSNSKEDQNREPGAMASIVERNIKALVERRIKEEKQKSVEEKVADVVTSFTANMAFVYTHLVLFLIWIIWNKGWTPYTPIDPNFTGIELFAAIEAIVLTTFVLISQKSLDQQADKRADLDLQISLLSEHEITRLLTLVSAIAEKLGVEEAHNEELNELAEDVMPEKVMDTMEDRKQDIAKGGPV
jgi:uncharacterized membrane protein